MAVNSCWRTVFDYFINCLRGCRKDQVKKIELENLKTFESGEEVTGDSSQLQTTSNSEPVQVVQPSSSQTGGSSVDSPKCFVHKAQNSDTLSEISSEDLTEFGELLQVPEQTEESSQEVIQTVPSFGYFVTLPTICESHCKIVPTVTEPEASCAVTLETNNSNTDCLSDFLAQENEITESSVTPVVVTSHTEESPQIPCTEEVLVKSETKTEEFSNPNLDKNSDSNSFKMETVEIIASGGELPSELDEPSLTGEGHDIDEALNFDPSNFDPSSISSLVEQLQAPPGNDQGEISQDQVDFQNTNGSLHDSLDADALEAALTESLNNVDIESPDVEEKTKDEEVKGNDGKAKKEKSKEEKKSKKKEDKTIDHILRALSSLHTTEEKLAALCKKYADLHEEHRVLQATSKQNTRKLSVVSREKDQLQSEHTKAVMAKSKLESLCRELQKHNQVIRQESLQRGREEDEKRKEISNKFQTTITEIQQQMTDHHDRNQKLREENQELAGKLKKFIEQYELREKQVEKVMQHRELEQKLADAKLAQANAILKEEQEKNKKERELLILQATEGQKKAALLEAQLAMYKERYEEFQSTINKSNEMFQKFKSEMDKMTKRIKKLEKDGAQWKQKWENANKALLEMAEEKTQYDREKPMLVAKIKKLESLCRAMQAERLGRKVLEASSLDPSKFEESLAANQGVDKEIKTELNPVSSNRESSPQSSDEQGQGHSEDLHTNGTCDTENPTTSPPEGELPNQSEGPDIPASEGVESSTSDGDAQEKDDGQTPAET